MSERKIRPNMPFIKQAFIGVFMQNYMELNRAAGDRHQWQGIVRMPDGQQKLLKYLMMGRMRRMLMYLFMGDN